MLRTTQTRVLATILLLGSATISQADWTRFRGPNGSGIVEDGKPVPVKWSASHNLKWKTALPGSGSSSPIVVGDRIYVTSYSGYGLERQNPGNMDDLKRHLLSIERSSGKVLWNRTIDAVLPEDPFSGPGVPAHGYATNTPVSDGENVYVFFGKTGALAFDRDGNQLWQTGVGTESDPRRYGSAASPILHKNLLIVQASSESEALVALNKETGEQVWRQEAKGLSSSWCTPIFVKVDENRTDLVVGVGHEIWGLNPDNGKLRWYCEGIQSETFYSSAVAHDGIVYAIEGGAGGSLAVRAGGKGNVTESHVVWKGRDSNEYASPIVLDGRVYNFARNIVTSINAKTGERLSRNRLSGSSGSSRRRVGGGNYASPILVDGRIYYVQRSGDMHVLSTGDEVEQLAVNTVTSGDEVFSATPAASNGELFIRSDKNLYCIASAGRGGTAEDSGQAAKNIQPTKLAAADDASRGGGGGGSAFEQRDRDGDGKISGRELTPRLRSRLARIDTDKDGAISLEEFQKEVGARRSRRPARSSSSRRGGSQTAKPDRPQRPEMDG